MQQQYLTQRLQDTAQPCGYFYKRSVFVALNTGTESNLHWLFMENFFWKANMPLGFYKSSIAFGGHSKPHIIFGLELSQLVDWSISQWPELISNYLLYR